MFTLSKIIDNVVKDCIDFGSGVAELDNLIIDAVWETYSKDENYDVVALYFLENDVIKLKVELKETLTEN